MVLALRHNAWMDKERFKKTCIKEIETKGGIDQSFYCTWAADLMLRQDAGRLMLGKYLSDKKIPWREGDDWGWRWQEIHQQPAS